MKICASKIGKFTSTIFILYIKQFTTIVYFTKNKVQKKLIELPIKLGNLVLFVPNIYVMKNKYFHRLFLFVLDAK